MKPAVHILQMSRAFLFIVHLILALNPLGSTGHRPLWGDVQGTKLTLAQPLGNSACPGLCWWCRGHTEDVLVSLRCHWLAVTQLLAQAGCGPVEESLSVTQQEWRRINLEECWDFRRHFLSSLHFLLLLSFGCHWLKSLWSLWSKNCKTSSNLWQLSSGGREQFQRMVFHSE